MQWINVNVVFVLIVAANCTDFSEFAEPLNDLAIELEPFLWPNKESIKSTLRTITSDSNLSTSCSKSISTLVDGLDKRRQWSMKVFDSSSFVFGTGILSGKYSNLGEYSQCLSVNEQDYKAKFCLFNMEFEKPPRMGRTERRINLKGSKAEDTWIELGTNNYNAFHYNVTTFAICLPDSCEESEIVHVLNTYTNIRNVSFTSYGHCSLKEDTEPDWLGLPFYSRMCLSILAFQTALVIVATLLAYFEVQSAPQFLVHFCAVRNTGKLVSPTSDPIAKRLSFLNAIRVIFLSTAANFHVYFMIFFIFPAGSVNWVAFKDTFRDTWGEYGDNMSAGMGVNLLICGLLAYVSWHSVMVKTDGRINFAQYIIARWARTFPVSIAVILILLGFPKFMGSGPFFNLAHNNITQDCLNYWWRDIVYINNLYPSGEICVLPGWILSADFQLYVCSFAVILTLYRNPKLGIILAAIIALLGVFTVGAFIHVYDRAAYPNASRNDLLEIFADADFLHLKTHNYISCYMIGLVLGHFIVTGKRIESKLYRAIGWAVAAVLYFSVFIFPEVLKNSESRLLEIVFGATNKTFYVLGTAWFFYCCSLNEAGFIGAFLSSKFFVPLGRMSFSAYMGHYLYVVYDAFTAHQLVEMRNFTFFGRVLNSIVVGYAIGYFIYLCFEAPLMSLAKSAFVKKDDTSKIDLNQNQISKKVN
ncbi:Nose resistant to fluoxetine protein 6 [Halotydeus destructor]|nr:Nose resistant to fluoxetine protein 6 [Halotydeus destructor]